jgi:AcrR family transcriptional regulator
MATAVRRTQQERASAMRHRLLEATIDCLVDHGYAGTSTTRVVERAGVTRGAQVHHFPTKAALVAAAIRHLADKRAELAFAELDRIKQAPDPVDSALDLMWDLHQGPVFHATVELWVAARTDPELHSQLSMVEPATMASVVEVAKTLFPDHAERQAFAHWVYTCMNDASRTRQVRKDFFHLGCARVKTQFNTVCTDLQYFGAFDRKCFRNLIGIAYFNQF